MTRSRVRFPLAPPVRFRTFDEICERPERRLLSYTTTRIQYGPWGERLTASTGTLDNATGNLDAGAFGQYGKLAEDTTQRTIIMMGPRPYSPRDGRFLSVDPVNGGCANSYVYGFGDPLNGADLSGKSWWNPFSWTSCGVAKVAGNASRILGTAAVVVAVGAVIVGTGGTAAVILGAAATAASAFQWGAGAAAGDSSAATNGMVGTTMGVLTLGTWGAASKNLYGPADQLSRRLVDGVGAYATASRWIASETVGAVNKGAC